MREEERNLRDLHAQVVQEVLRKDDDSRYCGPWIVKTTEISSPGNSDAKSQLNPGRKKGLIGKFAAEGKVIIVAVVIIIALIIAIIALAVTKAQRCPFCHSLASQGVACPDFWIGYLGKCFYISKEEKNWSLSSETCSSFNASLAVIDTQKELDFWVHVLNPFHYWFGLSRESNVWKWSNGIEFKTQFRVRGEGFCAYINGKGASSTICSMEKYFLCSHPESCSKVG